MLNLQNKMLKTANKVDSIKAKMEELKNVGTPTEEYKEMQVHLQEAQNNFDKLIAKQEQMQALGQTSGKGWESLQLKIEELGNAIEADKIDMQNLVAEGKAFSDVENSAEYKMLSSDLQMYNHQLKLSKLEEQELAINLANIEKKGVNSFARVGNAARKTGSLMRTMASRLKGILLSLLIFNWISKGWNAMISEMKEGFQNLAKYSDDYNKSISSLKSANAELKNNLAAAFAPIVQMAIPYLVKLIGWLNTAANAIAKFFAALQGKSTYTKAVQQNINYAASVKDIGTSAKKAAGSLAAFDDLNVLQKNDESGGGNNSGEVTGANAFEEAEIDESTFKWVDWLKSHLDDILTVAMMIGAAFLAWRVASHFTSDLSMLIGIAIAAAGAVMLIKNAFDAWNNGVDWGNLTGMLAGITMLIGGLGLAFGPLVASVGAIVGGLTLLAVCIKDIKENGLDWPNLIGFITGVTLVIVGLTTAIGPLAGSIAGVIGGLAMVVIGIQDVMQNGVTLKNGIMIVAGVFTALFTTVGAVTAGIGALIAALVLAVVADWENFKVTVLEPLKKWGQVLWDDFTRIGQGFKKILVGIIEFVAGVFTGNWKKAWNGIEKIFSGIWDAIVGLLKASVNLLIGILNTMYNAFVGVVNAVIAAINRIDITIPDWVPGFGGKGFNPNIQPITPVNIPYLAKGGITTGSTLANIGEAGREAVLPLENNTGWMDDLADKLTSRMPSYGMPAKIVMEVDGKEFARWELPYFNAESARIGVAFG